MTDIKFSTADTPAVADVPVFTAPERTQLQMVIRRFLRHRAAVVSLGVFVFMLFFAFVLPLFWPYDHTYTKSGAMELPSGKHLLGTDRVGHDLVAQVMRGTQQSLKVSLLVALNSTIIGALWGATAGFFRGKVDAIMMRIVDVMLTLPGLAVFLALGNALPGQGNWFSIALVLSVLGWTGMSRVVRSVVLSLREQEFIEAARAMGASNWRIITRHLLPNAIGPMIVGATIAIAGAILVETALSFLGFGIQPPDISLGSLLSNARDTLVTRPLLFYAPGVAIILIALSINFIGDGLRDALDPKQTIGRR